MRIISIITILFLLIFVLIAVSSCGGEKESINYREEMRSFVEEISSYAEQKVAGFIVIPQNGHELLTENGKSTGAVDQKYISKINGVGREDLFYGYDNDNEATPEAETNEMLSFMDLARDQGLKVMVTDYCWDKNKIDDSYSKNYSRGYISFAADHRDLDNIPEYPANPYHENTNDIVKLADAENFLYLINPDNNYSSKTDFINVLKATNYDLLIIDLFFDGVQLTSDDILSLRFKNNGGKRLVVCYMSIGEAEDYRYYWKGEWNTNRPSWLLEENPDWPGNYKVKYWSPDWKKIIFGTEDSYLDRILNTGFDGVYLDIIDAYEYFEE